MKKGAMVAGLLGCVILHASGQGDVWVGELRLRLAGPPLAEGEMRLGLSVSLNPIVVMRLVEDGSVRSRFVLGELHGSGMEQEEDAAIALADGLAAFLKTGKTQDIGNGVMILESDDDGLRIFFYRQLGVKGADGLPKRTGVVPGFSISKDEARHLEKTIRFARKRAKAFNGADLGLRRDALEKLQGRVVEEWRLSFELGPVDLPELGGLQLVSWTGSSMAGMDPRFQLQVETPDRGSPGPDGSIGHGLFTELGRVPDLLARGKTVRWEGGREMLRAFPENKAIYYRPDTRKAEDIRISLETAQEAWKMLEKRDRLLAWFQKEVEPGLVALVKQGRD